MYTYYFQVKYTDITGMSITHYAKSKAGCNDDAAEKISMFYKEFLGIEPSLSEIKIKKIK